jgi:hypothetical protein
MPWPARFALVLLLLLAGPARAQPQAAQPFAVLDTNAVPRLAAGAQRESYARFTRQNLPRAAVLAPDGRLFWAAGLGPPPAREPPLARALAQCNAHGSGECQLYAQDLDVVWPGRAPERRAAPGFAISSITHEIVADRNFLYWGPAVAAGVVVWAHGYGGSQADARGVQPPSFLRWFNNAGFDVFRFDRHPNSDGEYARVTRWLVEDLPKLRAAGYRQVVVGGQSRGAFNALEITAHPGLAEVVIAAVPGFGGGTNTGQNPYWHRKTEIFRDMIGRARPGNMRVALLQFADDPYDHDPVERARAVTEGLRGRVAATLVIDRPEGFSGHGAASHWRFGDRYGACLLRFATATPPPAAC